MVDLLVFLGLVNKKKADDSLGIDMQTLLETELDQSTLVSIFNSNDSFIGKIRPHILDMLKLNNRLTPLMEKLQQIELNKEQKKRFNQLNERLMLCSLVESVPRQFDG